MIHVSRAIKVTIVAIVLSVFVSVSSGVGDYFKVTAGTAPVIVAEDTGGGSGSGGTGSCC